LNTEAKGLPVIALAMGDPAGISPELTARLAASDDARKAARLVIIGDKRVFDAGAAVAGVAVDVDVVGPSDPVPAADGRPGLSAVAARAFRRAGCRVFTPAVG
jgi:4-hydroxythreonine-4-phosphate dehydrogenase